MRSTSSDSIGLHVVDLHLFACAAALVAGACAGLLPKGRPAHRSAGQLYVVATVVYCLSSFFIYTSTGQLTFFHAVSVQNLALVSAGMAMPRLMRHRAPNWRVWHLRFMAYSYVALVATGLRFALPLVSGGGRSVVAILAFVVVPVGAWVWVERALVATWRSPRMAESETRA